MKPDSIQRMAHGKYQKLGVPNISNKVANAPDRKKKRATTDLTHFDRKSGVAAIKSSSPPLCLVGYGIAQLADAFDRNFDRVAGDYRSNALGRAGGDQVAGFERHDL
jgi:hypothetical protein